MQMAKPRLSFEMRNSTHVVWFGKVRVKGWSEETWGEEAFKLAMAACSALECGSSVDEVRAKFGHSSQKIKSQLPAISTNIVGVAEPSSFSPTAWLAKRVPHLTLRHLMSFLAYPDLNEFKSACADVHAVGNYVHRVVQFTFSQH